MRLDEFQHLSEVSKGVAAMNGKYLAKRDIAGFAVVLYAVGDFYAEVYQHYLTNAVAYIDGFKDTERLLPYLETINVRIRYQQGQRAFA